MHFDTLGIVLSTIDYSDKYILVRIFTRDFGCVTYQVSKKSSRHSKVKRMLFQPLNLLRLTVKHQLNRDIHNIKEVAVEDWFISMHSNPIKSSLVFFLSEFLSKVLKEPNKDVYLFDFIRNSLNVLEVSQNSVANFHLVFFVKMTYFLGFYPNFRSYEDGIYFDLIEGEFVKRKPMHNHWLTKDDSRVVFLLGRMNFQNMICVKLSRLDRSLILEQILNYYKIHASLSYEFKTLEILKELY